MNMTSVMLLNFVNACLDEARSAAGPFIGVFDQPCVSTTGT